MVSTLVNVKNSCSASAGTLIIFEIRNPLASKFQKNAFHPLLTSRDMMYIIYIVDLKSYSTGGLRHFSTIFEGNDICHAGAGQKNP